MSDRRRLEFQDANGHLCVLAESLFPRPGLVWLGPDDGPDSRMLLTREMAATLITELQTFAQTGRLGVR